MPSTAAPRRRARVWVYSRRVVQILALLLFLALTLSISIAWIPPIPHDLFLRVDPLLWLTGSLAAREFALYAAFALALVLVTAGLGRVFCGWICPLGTIQDAAHAAVPRGLAFAIPRLWSVLRYGILAAVIGAGLWGVNLAGWLDPLVITTRALHLPPAGAERWVPLGVAWSVLLLAAGLVLLAPRLWCRVLCPLGTVLSLVARWSPWKRRVTSGCSDCGACSHACPMDMAPAATSAADCLVCGRCAVICPRGAITFGARPNPGPGEQPAIPLVDTSRRAALFSIGGLLTGTLLGLPTATNRNRSDPIRPPATPAEDEFTARCIGCGACLAACPTNGLQPLLRMSRLDSAFSPELVPRIGPCLPRCLACGTVCPTGAIRPSSPTDKWSKPIGLAVIDPTRCLPWARHDRCVICLDACPSEFHAIELKRGVLNGPFRPSVLATRCTGCGICENRCPVEGMSAIRIVPS